MTKLWNPPTCELQRLDRIDVDCSEQEAARITDVAMLQPLVPMNPFVRVDPASAASEWRTVYTCRAHLAQMIKEMLEIKNARFKKSLLF